MTSTFATQTIANNTAVKVHFGGSAYYAARVTGWQEGHIGLYEVCWLETVPNYMRRGEVDLIEHERVSLI